jgi:hypothetical protein
VCTSVPLPSVTADTWTATFDNRLLCNATGIPMEQGNRYEVRVKLSAPWRDGKNLQAWLNGFSSTARPGLFLPALPFRRVLTADWFVPVARVGSRGAEYHLFAPVDQAEQRSTEQVRQYDQAVAEITPGRTGELFLFVNDAIAPWAWDYFYRNNQDGPATVTVRKVGGTSR